MTHVSDDEIWEAVGNERQQWYAKGENSDHHLREIYIEVGQRLGISPRRAQHLNWKLHGALKEGEADNWPDYVQQDANAGKYTPDEVTQLMRGWGNGPTEVSKLDQELAELDAKGIPRGAYVSQIDEDGNEIARIYPKTDEDGNKYHVILDENGNEISEREYE